MNDIAMMIAIAKKFGGGSSTPAPVVILTETELTGEGLQYTLPNPPENAPIGGGNYRIVWDGVEYFSPALDVTGTIGEGTPMFAFGNSAVAFGEDGAAQIGNPAPGAPYFLALIPNGKEVTEGGPIAYGMLAATEEPTAPVLSVVEAAKTESAGGGGGVLMVNGTIGTPEVSEDGTAVASCTFDKTYAEIVAALNAGQYVVCKTKADAGEFILPIIMTEANAVTFGIYVAGKSIAAMLDSTDNGMLYVTQPSA